MAAWSWRRSASSRTHRLGSVCLRHLGEAPIGRIAYRNKQNEDERSDLVMMSVLASLAKIFFRLLIESLLTTE